MEILRELPERNDADFRPMPVYAVMARVLGKLRAPDSALKKPDKLH